MHRLYDMLVEFRLEGENESHYEKFKAENYSDLMQRFQIEHEGERLTFLGIYSKK